VTEAVLKLCSFIYMYLYIY